MNHAELNLDFLKRAESLPLTRPAFEQSLESDGARAINTAWKRFVREIDSMIDVHGVANVAGALAEVVRERADNAPEDSPLQKDYVKAADALDVAAVAVDLRYPGSREQ